MEVHEISAKKVETGKQQNSKLVIKRQRYRGGKEKENLFTQKP